MRRIDEIIIHCTGNRFDTKLTMSDLRKDHIRRGFRDVGYHFVIFYDGRVEVGRPLQQVGAHCKAGGHNAHSVGIAYVGGRTRNQTHADTRSLAQKAAMKRLLIRLLNDYPTIHTIVGHRDYDNGKVCPCFDAKSEYQQLLQTCLVISPKV